MKDDEKDALIEYRIARVTDTNAYNNRSTGDYDDFAEFDEDDVKKSFDEMKDFIKTIRTLL